jgi:TPR repeat protein
MMGAVYLGGVRTDKDLEKADKWFNKAIELDNGLVDLVKALKALAIEKENRVEQ